MAKEELISSCRYYKGEKECPFDGIAANLWDYEKAWVDNHSAKDSILSICLEEYNGHGFTHLEEYDGVPITLKALLFNRYYHWMGNADEFPRWYKEVYRDQIS